MKHLLFVVFIICYLNVYSQNQLSGLADWGIKRNGLSPYKQSSVGVIYRNKQNTFGLKYDIIDMKFRNFTVKQLYYIIGGTASYYRHFNTNKLSGFYGGVSVSYTQFSTSWGSKIKYNEIDPGVYMECVGPIYERYKYKQLSIIPTLGYEYYPIKSVSIFSEIGYGILSSIFTGPKSGYYYKPSTIPRYISYGNIDFKLGIKTVIWRKTKHQE